MRFHDRRQVRPSPLHGRGVFATTDLRAGTVVEIAPVVFVDRRAGDTDGELGRYLFEWDLDDDATTYAVALGIMSLLNHEGDPSCRCERVDDGVELIATLGRRAAAHEVLAPALVVTTARAVAAGEELTIDYSGRGDQHFPFAD